MKQRNQEDDDVLGIKVTDDTDLNDIVDKIKTENLMIFEPEEEKALEKEKENLRT